MPDEIYLVHFDKNGCPKGYKTVSRYRQLRAYKNLHFEQVSRRVYDAAKKEVDQRTKVNAIANRKAKRGQAS